MTTRSEINTHKKKFPNKLLEQKSRKEYDN